MISHGVLADVAAERSRTLRAEAEQFQRAKAARSADSGGRRGAGTRRPWWRRGVGQPVPQPVIDTSQPVRVTGQPVALRDGSHVLIRPIDRADTALLADGFSRLSARSRHHRFLGGKSHLTPAELRYFTHLDHYNHDALGALDPSDGRGVGIARYIRHPDQPHTADVAVTVVDDWHRRGLGTELLTQLAHRARHAGIRCFTAQVAPDNAAITGLMQTLGVAVDQGFRDDDTVEYTIPLDRTAVEDGRRLGAGC
jgi:RimJ/RimL family protein N-acetyltransferase